MLATTGSSILVADSLILEFLRKYVQNRWAGLYTLLTCYQCNAFWLGLFFGYLLISKEWSMVLACGCSGSFLSPFAVYVMNTMESIFNPKPINGINTGCKECGKKLPDSNTTNTSS